MPDSLAKYDPDTCLWKTSQACLFEEWIEFSETFPNSGMMRSGELYPQPMSEPPTSASGSGSWPTPQSRDYKGARLDGKTSAGSQTNLNDAVRQEWATPSAADAVGSTGGGQGRSLRTDVRNCPTPTARDWKSPGKRGRYRDGKLQLDTVDRWVQYSEQQNNQKGQSGGSLNPTWVEWLMGYPSEWTVLKDSETP
jgi:DNA (cytosine-5)-methyltransferase 1